ncbi:hypothetical protein L1281_001555 [Neisseria sp. HSC-16F19]|nr:hypothetical protein [Neisseria sp. HSC-16F19]MCP2040965.1 hypothetical protein [Neisseria sp. HSC-16F19]
MLDSIYAQPQKHFLMTCFAFLAASALISVAVIGSVASEIQYLIFLPVGLMCMLSSTFGLLSWADGDTAPARKKNYFAIEAALLLFALLLLPPSIWAFYSL